MRKSEKKKLLLYGYQFSMDEIPDKSIFDEYEIEERTLDKTEMPNIAVDIPAIFFVRIIGEEKDLWKLVEYLHELKIDSLLLLFKENPDIDFLQKAIDNHVDELIAGRLEDKKEEFDSKLRSCLRRLVTMNKIRRDVLQMEEINFEKKQKVMDELLHNALTYPELIETLRPEINERYGVNIGEHNFMAVVISVNRYELVSEKSAFLKQMILLAEHHLRSARELVCHRRDPYGLVVVINFPDYFSYEKLHKEFVTLRHGILELQKTYGEFEVTIGVGPMVKEIHQLYNSLIEASMAQEFRMFSSERILYAKDIPDVNRNFYQYISASTISELGRFVAMSNIEAVKQWFSYFYAEIEPHLHEYPPAYARLCWECYQFSLDLNKNAPINMFPEKKFFSLQNMFDGHKRIQRLEDILLEVCHMLKEDTQSDQEIAMHAIAYMKVHYSQPLNLETIAESCGVSPSYFSRKFKEQTGEKYIEVLTDIRIQEASKLLEETDLGILEIMERVGYLDDKHFRRVFTKRTSMTPTQYRKKAKAKSLDKDFKADM